jgi:predicted nuclease of predicted toxin-antitoxin system
MVRLATDADFNGRIVRGLRRKQPSLDILRAQDAGMRTAADPDILAWAAAEGRVLLTHDQETMIGFAYDRVRAGQPMAGLFVVLEQQGAIGRTIDNILVIDACSTTEEWADQVVFLPW